MTYYLILGSLFLLAALAALTIYLQTQNNFQFSPLRSLSFAGQARVKIKKFKIKK